MKSQKICMSVWKKLTSLTIILIVLLTLFPSCAEDINCPRNDPSKINPNLTLIRPDYDSVHNNIGSYWMGAWFGNKIYTTYPLRVITMGADFRVVNDTLLARLSDRYKYVSINHSGTKLLLVRSFYSNISIGSLIEYNLQLNTATELIDSTHNVSSAIYLIGDDKCIYYSYGDTLTGLSAGYYLYDIYGRTDSLLFRHRNEAGPDEILNGFDISPDNSKILIPLNYTTSTPKMSEINLVNMTRDTINMHFPHNFLWLRYDPMGYGIIYSNYPYGSTSGTTFDTSEVGYINLKTLVKTIFNVNTSPVGKDSGRSVNIFPSWSTVGTEITFGSAAGPSDEPPGSVGRYSLYILRNIICIP
jgi:hypothetical protein